MNALERIERAEEELRLAKVQLELEPNSGDAQFIMKQLGEHYKVRLITDEPYCEGRQIVVEIKVGDNSHTAIITNFERIHSRGYYLGNVGRFGDYIQLRLFSTDTVVNG